VKIVDRKDIDIGRWNKLVRSTKESSFFSYGWYLDAVAENWCVLVNDDYSCGIALPFSTRFGVVTLYTPIFVRYVEILGNEESSIDFEQLIRTRFTNICLATKKQLFNGSSEQVYQNIKKNNDRNVGSQAKRMLKKASKLKLTTYQSNEYELVLSSIKEGLENKHQGLNSKSMLSLEQLIKNAKTENALNVIQIDYTGGIVCLESDREILYLKGVVDDSTKKNGGMYLALNTAIENAIDANKNFDFGGSKVEGVKGFNHNLGGKNVVYYLYENVNYPWWYRLMKKMK
tara:strand:+ start:20884 stop:21744 length:861 start_codon:yes stop_codon:yes gene_type:complete